MMSITKYLALKIIFLFTFAGVITTLNTNDKIIAITFDACETKTPAYFDKDLLDFIISKEVPVTLFLSGKFIERNIEDVKRISKLPFIQIENHSYSHQDFRKLSTQDIVKDVLKNEQLIADITGKKPTYFRFPYGYYNEKALETVKSMGYKIVHWSFESGDPDKNLSTDRLINTVIRNTKEGTILIFHINGRGWKIKFAFPKIFEYIVDKNYKPVLLRDVIFKY